MSPRALSVVGVLGCLSTLPACEKLDSFDTGGEAAYCGRIVDAQFVRSLNSFDHETQMRVTIDTAQLNSSPVTITTDDSGCGDGVPTFSKAAVTVPPELKHDPLSVMTFEEGQIHNIVGWADTSCNRTVLAVVSLYKADRVAVRLLEPKNDPIKRDAAFSIFTLSRNENGCGF